MKTTVGDTSIEKRAISDLLSKKLAGAAIGGGSVYGIVQLIAAGVISPPLGIAFAVLAVAAPVAQIIMQGRIDLERAKHGTKGGPKPSAD